MGCIHSKRKEYRGDNFRIRAVQIAPESCSGYLELTSRELIFTKGGDSNGGTSGQCTVWALQHLRRYGMREDLFSFEAGRRCMTGQGIYTFRCPNHAESLYHLFQRSLRNTDALNCTAVGTGATNAANNYLDPAPMTGGGVGVAGFRTTLRESFSSSPLSLELDSPDSVPSLSFTNEVVHFQSQQSQARSAYGNVYLEQPFRPQQATHYTATERNNNTSNAVGHLAAGMPSAGNTITYGATNNGKNPTTANTTTAGECVSQSGPPEECAPMLSPGQQTDAIHMYANVDNLGNQKAALLRNDRDKFPIDPAERCYENLTRADMPLMLHTATTGVGNSGGAATSGKAMTNESASSQPSTPCTVTTPTTPQVNYIVLDLDQPRSPTQCSPKTFGSGLSLLTGGTVVGGGSGATDRSTDLHSLPNTMSMTLPSMKGHHGYGHASIAGMSASMTTAAKLNEARDEKTTTESSLGYSTIDFIKTCALIKSANGRAGDGSADHEESRITRHSKCVRKAYSISE